jgi:predicted nucleic acid-binding protein
VIVADSSAIIALLDKDDSHHAVLVREFSKEPSGWILPWAVLPEVDYVAHRRLGARVEQQFLRDTAAGIYAVEWGNGADLARAAAIEASHKDLGLGLVDAVVMAVAERLAADAIATLDLRHFAPVRLKRPVKLYPRDL